ncbi:MAG: HlyD family efflux transporter periplasmic adaptor subunit [Planctomycetes bacterium]|nr:HlyD family efflux transporter periplasmic adaptor subunit [Planctomycetota bacterium]
MAETKTEESDSITPAFLPDYSRTRFRRTFFLGRMVIYTSCCFILGILALMFFAKIDETVVTRGKVKPRKDVDVRALDVGVLIEVYVQPEDIVKAGEILAKYDDKIVRDELASCKEDIAEAKATLAAADAKLARLERDPLPEKLRFTDAERKIAETRLATTEKDFMRLARLFKNGIVSRADYEEAKGRYELAKSETQIAVGKDSIVDEGLAKAIINEAKAERAKITVKVKSLTDKARRIQEKLDRTLVKAPIGGQIILADKGSGDLIKPGVSVKPGDRLFTIATGVEREVHLWVPEEKIYKIGKGQPVRIRSVFDYQKYGEARGHIDEVSLYATEKDNGQKLFWVRAVVDESPMPLPFGSSVTAYIVVNRRTLLDMYILNRD